MRAPSSFERWNFRPSDNWTSDIWSSEHLNFWTLIFWTNELKRSVVTSSIVKHFEVCEEFWSRLIAGIIAFLRRKKKNTIWYLSVPLKKWMFGLNNKLGKNVNIWRYFFSNVRNTKLLTKYLKSAHCCVGCVLRDSFLKTYLKVRNIAE